MEQEGLPRKVAVLRCRYPKVTKEKAAEDIEISLTGRKTRRKCSIEYPVNVYELQPYGKCKIATGFDEAVVFNFDESQGKCFSPTSL